MKREYYQKNKKNKTKESMNEVVTGIFQNKKNKSKKSMD